MSLTIRLHITTTNAGNRQVIREISNNKTAVLPRSIKIHENPLSSLVYRRKMLKNITTKVIKSSLIEPDGGSLVDLVVPENERASKISEAGSLPRVMVTKIDLEWVHVLSEGWASPLRGFMRENEYLRSLHFNCLRLEDGSFVNMSLPIVLAIDDETKERIGSSPDVGLVKPNGDLIGILRRVEIYKHNKEERVARTWGTTAPGLPYVEEVITPAGNWLIGGDLEVLKEMKYDDGLDHYRLSPRQLRKEFDRREADAVFAFQLRNPFRVAAYDTSAKKMAFFDPSRSRDFLFISGTKMRNYARNGDNPPDGFMCPGGWQVLVKYYESLQAEESKQQSAVLST